MIGTIRRECLDHVIVLTEQHLRRVLREYVGYYNANRPHRSLALEPPDGPRMPPSPELRQHVGARPVLGGMHHVYECGRMTRDDVFVPHRRHQRSAVWWATPISAATWATGRPEAMRPTSRRRPAGVSFALRCNLDLLGTVRLS